MSLEFFDLPADLDWLFETYVTPADKLVRSEYKRAVVWSFAKLPPRRIELFKSDKPLEGEEPDAIVYPKSKKKHEND